MEPMKRRLLSGILAGLTLLSCGPVPALAVSGGDLCPNHPVHTEECGYVADEHPVPSCARNALSRQKTRWSRKRNP